MMMFDTVLSVATGFHGCWWPISDRAVLMDIFSCKFSNNPPNYASVADSITFIIMLHSTCSETFLGGLDYIVVLDVGPRKKHPPALIFDSGIIGYFEFKF